MSEEATEVQEVKKKKGKLPIILVLLLVLGGGGFFMMKSKSSGPKKVEIKAGEVAPLDKEFLINLAGGPNVYLRAEIALQLREGFKKEALDANMPAIRDCINQIFRSKTLQEVGAEQTDSLRKEIAAAVNSILIHHMTAEEKKAQDDFDKEAGGGKSDKKSEKKKKEESKDDEKGDENDEENWPSPAGPVLDVYFTSFTTQ